MQPTMQPIAAMALDGIAGIFADLDDTMTWQGALVPEAYAALCEAREAGLRVVVATGRAGGWAEVLAALWPVDAVVAENGGYTVLRDGGRRFWDDEPTRAEQRHRLESIIAAARAELPFAKLAEDNDLRRVDVAFDLHEHQSLSPDEVAQLASLVRAHGARVITSSIHLHAFYGDHDKPRMLARLGAELWGEDAAAIKARHVYVGDSPNDQAAFAWFPRSVGVANVAKHLGVLRPPPSFVASRPGGHGFAEVARMVTAAHIAGRARP